MSGDRRFTATGPTTGQVPVTGPGLSPSTVYLRRLERDAGDPKPGRQQSIWYIQGVGTPALAVLDVDYDGQRLVASFIPASNGTLTVRVTGLDERLLAEQVTSTRTGHLNPVDIDAPGQPALVVSATLALADGSIAPREFRIGAPGATELTDPTRVDRRLPPSHPAARFGCHNVVIPQGSTPHRSASSGDATAGPGRARPRSRTRFRLNKAGSCRSDG